ncbi:MAG: helix-turn-helix transcriptional regulator [Clostridia bacterium]|nr:helix-turn-helix transcriptional regulator [Oscillospiraceae bacterium]MBQ7033549.1 helix-turn-helix transcriptional regulator [Clostridia bacterium]
MKNKIKEHRKMRKLTQDDLAKAVDVTRQTIISLENGKYIASLQLAHRLAKFFDTEIEKLFIFEEDEI